MKKNLNQKFLNRLAAQAEEAERIGLTSIAEHLTKQIVKNADMQVSEAYYNADEFDQDIETSMWDAVIAIANFHNTVPDALQMQAFISKFASEFIAETRKQMGVKTSIGTFENKVPGEI